MTGHVTLKDLAQLRAALERAQARKVKITHKSELTGNTDHEEAITRFLAAGGKIKVLPDGVVEEPVKFYEFNNWSGGLRATQTEME